jgi:putative DNA modification/repair radical SAM protein
MNGREKLRVLSMAAQYDRCNYLNYNLETVKSGNVPGIHESTSGECVVRLFKVLMTNKCSNDCRYCINHSMRKFKRFQYTPDELTALFMDYYQNRLVDGLFLSSGAAEDVEVSMESMVEVARKLRLENEYNGYIHLKILPGASYDLIKRAMSLADRVSVNMEAATEQGFSELTTTKDYRKDIIKRIRWIDRLCRKDENLAPSGQTTQFMVGAAEENDQEILKRIDWLYNKFNIKRNYFSSFTPLEDTPMEKYEAPHPKRAGRLYQADYLLKSYGFDLDELRFDEEGNLAVEMDPKYYAAINQPELFPVEINRASFRELIRIPGIGKISARRIINSRKGGKCFEKLSELKKLGVVVERAEPFLKLNRSFQSQLMVQYQRSTRI